MATRRSGPYLIGDRTFRTKKAAEAHIQEILHRATVDEPLAVAETAVMLALLESHPDRGAKIGVGVASIHVRPDSEWGTTRHFVIVRTDGTFTDFSFKKCLTPASPLQLFKQACRHTVADQVTQFRNGVLDATSGAVLMCPILEVPIGREEIHVDHAPPWTFDSLVLKFIEQEQIDVQAICVTGFGDNEIRKDFQDSAIRERWQEFHRLNARLRLVSKKANLSDIRRSAKPGAVASGNQ
jgi:hypothetical protein